MPGPYKDIKTIDKNTIANDIECFIDEFINDLNIKQDYKTLTSIKHSTINYMFTCIYKHFFKPSHNLPNNEKSIINYSDIELLQVLCDEFILICQRFNKSMGLMSFSYMTGIAYTTFMSWINKGDCDGVNRARLSILKKIQETHKAQQIALLNDSPVGALAVANNDTETGLNWSRNQAQQITNNTVYYLPSERGERLKLAAADPSRQ